MPTISVSFPFERTLDGGVFKSTNTTQEAIRAKLASLMTTKKGHRVMRPDLYSPLYDYIMEPWDEFSKKDLIHDVEHKILRYLPEINIKDITAELQDDGATLSVKIVYAIVDLGNALDNVTFFVPTQNE